MKKNVWMLPVFFVFFTGGCRPTFTPPLTPLSISATISTNQVRVGDPVHATLIATHASDGRMEWPVMENDPRWTIQNKEVREDKINRDWSKTTVRYQLAPFELGTLPLTTGTATLVRSDKTRVSTAIPLLLLMVKSVLTNTTPQLEADQGLLPWPTSWTHLLLWGIALIMLGLALFLMLRPYFRKRLEALSIPPTPPHEIALQALKALKAQGWMERGEAGPFYVELSLIVRRYIEARFQVQAPEMTTEEFIRVAVQHPSLSAPHRQLTADFLEQSDLVKFARYLPGTPEMQQAYSAAERLVMETIPAPPTAPKESCSEAGPTYIQPPSRTEGRPA